MGVVEPHLTVRLGVEEHNTFLLIQLLTGQCYFGSYLYRNGREITQKYHRYDWVFDDTNRTQSVRISPPRVDLRTKRSNPDSKVRFLLEAVIKSKVKSKSG